MLGQDVNKLISFYRGTGLLVDADGYDFAGGFRLRRDPLLHDVVDQCPQAGVGHARVQLDRGLGSADGLGVPDQDLGAAPGLGLDVRHLDLQGPEELVLLVPGLERHLTLLLPHQPRAHREAGHVHRKLPVLEPGIREPNDLAVLDDRAADALDSNQPDGKHGHLLGPADLVEEPQVVGVVIVPEIEDSVGAIRIAEDPLQRGVPAGHSTRLVGQALVKLRNRADEVDVWDSVPPQDALDERGAVVRVLSHDPHQVLDVEQCLGESGQLGDLLPPREGGRDEVDDWEVFGECYPGRGVIAHPGEELVGLGIQGGLPGSGQVHHAGEYQQGEPDEPLSGRGQSLQKHFAALAVAKISSGLRRGKNTLAPFNASGV